MATSTWRIEKERWKKKKVLLVVGGTGYLGQHLLQQVAGVECCNEEYEVGFTYHSSSSQPPQLLLEALRSDVKAFPLDLQTGQGFDTISSQLGQPHVVVNCAAMSIPRACEMDPVLAMATNVPSHLIDWLASFTDYKSLLIHLSTDQGLAAM